MHLDNLNNNIPKGIVSWLKLANMSNMRKTNNCYAEVTVESVQATIHIMIRRILFFMIIRIIYQGKSGQNPHIFNCFKFYEKPDILRQAPYSQNKNSLD